MEAMMTMMMKSKMKAKGIASIEELRSLCLEADVKYIACQMTVDLFDFSPQDLIDGIEFGGASMFLAFAGEFRYLSLCCSDGLFTGRPVQ